VTEPNVTAISRKTGGAQPDKTEGGKSFTVKALPPSSLGTGAQASLLARYKGNRDSCAPVAFQIAADETLRVTQKPSRNLLTSSKGDEQNDCEKVFERIN
jgi:hypothetical protein